MIKHATASAFVFCPSPSGEWKLGLIEHPRLCRWMIPGGHVEVDESQAQAALREVEEESGLRDVRLIEMSAPPLPVGFPPAYERVPLPWWITEQLVSADNHLAEPHVHVDHQYVGVTGNPIPTGAAVHPFVWYGALDVSDLPMFEDTRLLAKVLFHCIGDLVTGRPAGVAALETVAAGVR
jgi:8-oxo-dGTP pyrophosphatase MutT (NUDIX family)